MQLKFNINQGLCPTKTLNIMKVFFLQIRDNESILEDPYTYAADGETLDDVEQILLNQFFNDYNGIFSETDIIVPSTVKSLKDLKDYNFLDYELMVYDIDEHKLYTTVSF